MDYSVIVVDDERIIREGLKSFIDKKVEGFYVKDCFEDGSDALDFLENNIVDVVLTDLKMAVVSGLEVAEYIHSHVSNTIVVILSGYGEFEYAQRAMLYGVNRYLLKPAANDEILKTFSEIREELNRRKETTQNLSHYSELIERMRKEFFVDLMFGESLSDDKFDAEFEKLGFLLPAEGISAIVLRICWESDFIENKWPHGRDRVNNIILNYFLSDENCIFAMLLETDIFLVLTSSNCTKDLVDSLVQWAKTQFETALETEILYQCKGVAGLSGWKVSDNTTADFSDTIKMERIKLLHTYINLGMYEQGKELFAELWHAIGGVRLMDQLLTAGKTANIKFDECLPQLSKSNSPGEIFDVLYKKMQTYLKSENEIVNKIRKYIQENYEKNISLESVADKVYLHSVYVSKLFKQHIGETFSDYLLDVRMTNAILLLKQNRYKIFEIAEMVGYKSAKYFSKQFKKYTGYTPKQYCRITWNFK